MAMTIESMTMVTMMMRTIMKERRRRSFSVPVAAAVAFDTVVERDN